MEEGISVFAPDVFSLFVMRGSNLEMLIKLPMYIGLQYADGTREIINVATEVPAFFRGNIPAGITSYAESWQKGNAIPCNHTFAYAFIEPMAAIMLIGMIENYFNTLPDDVTKAVAAQNIEASYSNVPSVDTAPRLQLVVNR